jgi:tetratricopeptide (TPR) repeat protein
LAIREKVLGSQHPEVAAVLYNLGELYRSQGKYSEAEPLLERSLAIMENALGPDHPDVAKVLFTYATLLKDTNRPDESAKLEERAKKIRASHSNANP